MVSKGFNSYSGRFEGTGQVAAACLEPMPIDKVLKNIFCIPGAQVQDEDDADANAATHT